MNWNNLLSEKKIINENETFSFNERSDYDRIICSTLFRRLQDKAQVFPLDEDDYVRTRLTHSLEVSAIGKKLGEYVFRSIKEQRLDNWFDVHTENLFSDILLCAGLVHDIGNPPFGHFGEYAIREWFQKNLNSLSFRNEKVSNILDPWQIQDLYSFEGNAQSLRILCRTPYLGNTNGFNLSYSILGTIMKYPISSKDLKSQNTNTYKKFGYYYSEKELFEDMCNQMDTHNHRHPLSYLLEASDDIAYRTSDLEDALVKKVISFQEITTEFEQYTSIHTDKTTINSETISCMKKLQEFYQEELIKNRKKPHLTAIQRWNQYIQEIMIKDAGNTFIQHYDEIMQGSFNRDLFVNTVSGNLIEVISTLSEKFIYTSSLKTRTELFGRKIINSLLDEFMPAAILYDTDYITSFIDQRTMDSVSDFYKSMYHSMSTGKTEQEKLYLRILMITDYISGMTDNYAQKLYRELFI